MNQNISCFLGRSDIVFVDQENGYTLMRKGKLAENLSKGEKNAIALIYFFNSLNDTSLLKENTIVVLDDPISSFDSNFYYHAVSFIRNGLEGVGQAFVFTHKFSLYKDLCRMCDSNTNHYVIERISNKVQISLETPLISKYYDEYIYLFGRIFTYAINTAPDPEDALIMANLARKLLESYLTFKVPTNIDNIEKIRILSGGLPSSYRALIRLVNTRSHLRVIRDTESIDDFSIINEMQQTAIDLLSFIFKTDKLHFRFLVENCDVPFDRIIQNDELNLSTLEPAKYVVKLFDWPAAAGYSVFPEDAIAYSEITVETPCDFAVKISGDSMEPIIKDGDIALVNRNSDALPLGQCGIYCLNSEILCKRRIQRSDNRIYLKSDNPDKSKYPDILIKENDSLLCFGKVIRTQRS